MVKSLVSRNERLVIYIATCLSFSQAVSSVFANMYLYRYLEGIAALTAYNLCTFALMPVAFYAAARGASLFGKKAVLIAGLGCFVVFYALLLGLGERAAQRLVPLGSLSGIAHGFFWYAFNIVITEATTEESRGRFFGWYGAFGAASGAAAPAVSSVLLSLAPSLESGYAAIFALTVALLLSTAAAAASLRLPDSRVRFTVLDKLRPGTEPGWRFIVGANFVYGIRDGANWSVLSVLVLKAAGGDIPAGRLTVLFALFGVAANLAGGRALTARRGLRFWLWGSLSALVSSVLLVAFPVWAGAAVAGSLWRVGEALVLLPFNVAVYNILSEYQQREGSIAGRNVAMEFVLNLGRALGAGAFLGLSFATDRYAELLFPLVTLALPASFLIYRKYLTRRSWPAA